MTGRRPLPLRTPAETAAATEGGPVPSVFDDRRAGLAVYRAMAHNPDLLRAWLPLCDYFLESPGLDPRDREVMILRTSVRCGAVYEWDKHASKAESVGVTAAELDALRAEVVVGLDPWTAVLVDLVDELHTTSTASDPTWAALVDRLGEPLAFTCLMLVGQYHMLAFALNGAGLTTEPIDDPKDPA